MTTSLQLRRGFRWLYRVALVVGLAYLLSTLDGQALWLALRHVPPWALCAGAACAFVNLFGKGTTWWLLLSRSLRPPLLSLWAIHLRAAASSILMPLRAGEGLRIYWLVKQFRIDAPTLVAVALAEKAINVATLLGLVAAAACLEDVPLPWLSRAGGSLAVTCGALCALALLLVVLRRRLGRAGASLMRVLQRGIAAWLGAGACALIGWLGDSLLVWLMANAVHVDLHLVSAPLVLLAINVGIALPSTPGHVGTMELAAAAALGAYGASGEAALSFALLYHGVQVLPVLLAAGLTTIAQRHAGLATAHRATPGPPPSTPPSR